MAFKLRMCTLLLIYAFCFLGISADRHAETVSCAKPEAAPPISWAILETSIIGNGSTFVVPGTVVQFSCGADDDNVPSYDLIGAEKVTCLRTGVWSDPVPSCRQHHEPVSTTPVEDSKGDGLSKDAMTIIVIVGAVVTFLVFATFVFVVVARRWFPHDCNRRRRLLHVVPEDVCASDYNDSDHDLLVAAAAAAHLRCSSYPAPPPSYDEAITDGIRGHLCAPYSDDDYNSDFRFINSCRAYRPLVGAVMEPALVSTMSSLTDAGLDTRSLGAQSAVATGAFCANRCYGRHGVLGGRSGAAGNDTVSEILPCDTTSASDASTFVTLSTYDGTNSSHTSGVVCSLASAADAQSDCPPHA